MTLDPAAGERPVVDERTSLPDGDEAPTPLPAVGHVVRTYLPRTATFIYSLLLNQRGFEPVVFTREIVNREEFPLERVLELLPRPGRTLGQRVGTRLRAHLTGYRSVFDQRLAAGARDKQCVLLHAHFGVQGCRSLAARRRLDLPLITTFYGYDLAVPLRERSWRRRYQRLFAEGTLFVCEGPAMAKQLEAIGCPAERIRVVRIGVDIERIPFDPLPLDGPPTLIQAARLVDKKGVDVSLRAFAAARAELGGGRFLIVGDGPERPRLEDLARELGLGESVTFLGSLAYGEYQQALRQADIGIQPSRTAEDGDTEGGAPTVLIEMQAAGMPVLGTRHADLPFVVAEHDQLVDEEDADGLAAAMVRLAELPRDRWLSRVSEARAFVEREHDAKRVAARVEDVYREALVDQAVAGSQRGGDE